MATLLNAISGIERFFQATPKLAFAIGVILICIASALLIYTWCCVAKGWCAPAGLYPLLALVMVLANFSESDKCDTPDYTDGSSDKSRNSLISEYDRKTDPYFFWGAIAANLIIVILIILAGIWLLSQ